MSSNKKKASGKSYLKIIGFMLIGALLGSVVGFMSAVTHSTVGHTAHTVTKWLGENSIWFFWMLLAVSTVYDLLQYRHMKVIGDRIRVAEDNDEDACDLEYAMNRDYGIFMIVYYGILFLGMFLFSVYMDRSFNRSKEGEVLQILVLYLLAILIQSVMQVRMVRLLQKLNPMKKGDPGDLSFEKDWLASCDEGEREIIYQSAYHTYKVTNMAVVWLAAAALICHMVWETGVFAVAALTLLGIIQVVAYQVNTLRLQKKKLRG
ncbi:MAG: DUF3169 family protein [Blautia sp.]